MKMPNLQTELKLLLTHKKTTIPFIQKHNDGLVNFIVQAKTTIKT